MATPEQTLPVWAQPLLSGDAGIEQTVAQMRQLVDEALRDPAIIRLATDIVRSVPAFDDAAEARAIYDWVASNIHFTKDPVSKEKLYPAAELLKIRAGDCDDISMLMATLLMAVGYPARLVTVAAIADAPEQFSHVYVEAEVPPGSNQWLPMDAARAESDFGAAPPVTYRRRWWSLADESYGELGAYYRFQSFWDAPPRRGIAGLGQEPQSFMDAAGQPEGDSTSALMATTGSEVADIIRAAQGQPASPFSGSTISATKAPPNPWASQRLHAHLLGRNLHLAARSVRAGPRRWHSERADGQPDQQGDGAKNNRSISGWRRALEGHDDAHYIEIRREAA